MRCDVGLVALAWLVHRPTLPCIRTSVSRLFRRLPRCMIEARFRILRLDNYPRSPMGGEGFCSASRLNGVCLSAALVILTPPSGSLRIFDWPICLRHQGAPAQISPAFLRRPPCAGPVLTPGTSGQEDWTRARNGVLKTDGSNPLSAPLPSEQKAPTSQPCLSWIPVVWATHVLRASMVNGRVKARRGRLHSALSCLPLFTRFLVSSWQPPPRELCILKSSARMLLPADSFPWPSSY